MNKKVIIAGDQEYGLGQALKKQWPEAKLCSRKTGYDLCDDKAQNSFAEESLNFDVFINCSSLWKFNQTLLSAKVWDLWSEKSKEGHFIHLGSTADTGYRGGSWMYPIEKTALKTLNRNLSYSAIGNGKIKSTLISPGYLSTSKVNEKHPTKAKLQTAYIVEVIKWVLEQPHSVNINEISLDPIQAETAK